MYTRKSTRSLPYQPIVTSSQPNAFLGSVNFSQQSFSSFLVNSHLDI
nr:MAG TPA: hypothetical protein [Herelleviridae sp.]